MIRDKHFMIDIEATGVDFCSDDILEIGIVELDFMDGYWRPGRTYQTFVWSDRRPESEFAKQHMEAVYAKANKAIWQEPHQHRQRILDFFDHCGRKNHGVLFTGWNAANFDIPMLHAKGFLNPPRYETVDGKDKQVGDHHYRIYEMCGAIQLAADVLQKPYDEFKEQIKESYPMYIPEGGKQHDAIYDCYMQTKMLNGLIKVMREQGTRIR